MMIKLYEHELRPGDERRFHQATLVFKLDDAGLEHLRKVLRDQFQAELAMPAPALPPGPIDAEFVE